MERALTRQLDNWQMLDLRLDEYSVELWLCLSMRLCVR